MNYPVISGVYSHNWGAKVESKVNALKASNPLRRFTYGTLFYSSFLVLTLPCEGNFFAQKQALSSKIRRKIEKFSFILLSNYEMIFKDIL